MDSPSTGSLDGTAGGPTSPAGAEHSRSGSALTGRRAECETLDRLVAGVQAGHSQVLVLRGEAGIGKTVLLDDVARRASGCRIARAWGVESEMELAFAGLHQLCAPMLGELDRLFAPQRDALATVFGLSSGPAPDRFLVGLAVLSLLSNVAEDRPLVCLIDDAQWLDRASAQALEFVARRLLADPVALVLAVRTEDLVLAVRTEDGYQGFATLPELVLEGLSEDEARELLRSTLPGLLDGAVRERIVADSRGNPLALLEGPRGLTPAELAGGFGLPYARPMAGYIEDGFRRRLEPLPVDTRRLMLLAAVEPVGDVSLLWRAAAGLGISAEAATPAESAGLLELGTRVRFRHPLVRSAVCRAADLHDLRDAHRVLAEATDPEAAADRRAWHLAAAAAGPDEAVAGELERSAERARARGGTAASAAFLKRAAELTRDPAQRGRRALAAARSAAGAGALPSALDLLGAAAMCPLDDLRRARLERLRGECMVGSARSREALPVLLGAARQLEPLDAGRARDTYLTALHAVQFAGRLGGSAGALQIAEAARGAPAMDPPRPCDLLLDGLAVRFTDGYAAAVPALKRALEAFRHPGLPAEEVLRWLSLATTTALDLWDDEAAETLASRHLGLSRRSGMLGVFLLAVYSRVVVHMFAGELAAAASLADETRSFPELNFSHLSPYGPLLVAAWRGDGPGVGELAATVNGIADRGEGHGRSVVEWAKAVLAIGSGHYEDALAAARAVSECSAELGLPTWALVDVVEAASRIGRPAEAAEALRRLAETTRAAGTDWAHGVEARSRALVSVGEEAEGHYLQAIKHLACSRVRVELARSHLVYGEWLRRAGRRVDAREQLRTAYGMFADIGADGFAERARRELLATGETARKRNVESAGQLTAQETQIARLAADGRTNPEIGAELFLSARTVEWHLRKVYPKLGVTSRRELGPALFASGLDAGSATPMST
jgi:DNA-binding CsgD family transcriptional regulator